MTKKRNADSQTLGLAYSMRRQDVQGARRDVSEAVAAWPLLLPHHTKPLAL